MPLNIPVFIINLDECVDRWRSVTAECYKIGLKNFQRVSGLKACGPFDEKSFSQFYSKFGGLPTMRYVAGSIGCKLSHLQIIVMARTLHHRRVMVLEDDIEFRDGTKEKISLALDELDNEDPSWEILYLAGCQVPEPTRWLEHSTKIPCALGTAALIYNDTIYGTMLDNCARSGYEIDRFLAYEHRGNYYMTKEWQATCKDFPSTING